MAHYIQQTPDVPPEFSLQDMKDSGKLLVPVSERPTRQLNKINLKNVFAITLRDAGKLALVDGDNHKIWKILDTGYAVHISRLSASGRYVYTVGRSEEHTSELQSLMRISYAVFCLKKKKKQKNK